MVYSPKILLLGDIDVSDVDNITSIPIFYGEEMKYDCYFNNDNSTILDLVKNNNIDVIIFVGDISKYEKEISECYFSICRKMLHFNNKNEIRGDYLYNCFIDSILNVERNNEMPLISVFTPVYRIGERFRRVYDSMLSQTYTNWEWVLFDDSDDSDVTYNMLKSYAETDGRIQLYKANKKTGKIGESKRRAASLCTGKYLVELDHDDVLLEHALECVYLGFDGYKNENAKFLYTDSCELIEGTDVCVDYGEWGQGFGYDYNVMYKEKKYYVHRTPINCKTIRHIIAAPNHIRAWEREFYHQIGGHNPNLHIADDYEIMARSFLYTNFIHVPVFCYIQYMNVGGNNTQEPRRAEIQRAVSRCMMYYDTAIHERFKQLNVEDFVYDETTKRSNINIPNIPYVKDVSLKTSFQNNKEFELLC